MLHFTVRRGSYFKRYRYDNDSVTVRMFVAMNAHSGYTKRLWETKDGKRRLVAVGADGGHWVTKYGIASGY